LSRLRGKCPFCRTFTAVALGPDYECHSCGRAFGAGLVRVPQAWGEGGEAMAEAAWLELPYPEAAVVEADSLEEQSLALAADLPERPLVLGGCCCSHVGAVEGLAATQGRVSLLWLDSDGVLTPPVTSPSGDQWGMPLRMLLDSGAVEAGDVALVGARALDPAEREFLERSSVRVGVDGIGAALSDAPCAYVALDCDVVEPGELSVFMPEAGGLALTELERLLAGIAGRTKVLGAGLTGLSFEPSNVEPLARLTGALGL
jgi:arginase family enzyme